MPKNPAPIYLALLVVNLIWGAAGSVIKYTLDYIPPVTFLFYRYLLVCLILLPYIWYELKKVSVPARDLPTLFLLGIAAQTSNIIAFISLKYTTALDSAIIGVTASVMAIYAGHYFYKEKINPKLKLGLLIASLGTVIIVLEPLLSGHNDGIPLISRVYGNILAFIYNLTWVTYVVWSKYSMGQRSGLLKKTLSFVHLKPTIKTYSPTLITAITFYVGLITVLPFMIVEQTYTGSFNIFNVDTKGLWGFLYMVILSSIIAYMLNQWALEKAQIAEITIFGYLGTVFAFPAAFVILGEIPNTFMLIGAGIIAIGVVIAEYKNN